MRPLIPLVILCLFCCENTEEPLITNLTNTSWIIERTELIQDGIVTTHTPDPGLLQILSFRENHIIQISGDGDGCGRWIAHDGLLKFRILYQPILRGLCWESNHINIFTCNNKVELTGPETLAIEGLCGTLGSFYHIPGWLDIRIGISQGNIQAKTYFIKVPNPQLTEQPCCGKLWPWPN